MSKKTCYFKCKYDGQLYGFPPVTYNSYEKFCKWKEVLRNRDKEKSDRFIIQNFKLCSNHFEKYYIAANNRLTRHAVPTLNLSITQQQQELLCTFIKENPKVIVKNVNGQMLEKVKFKWRNIGPRLNELGPEKSFSAWAEYLHEIISDLKTKKVIWIKEIGSSKANIQMVKNSDDFTGLELTILQLWRQGTIEQNSSHLSISDFREENEINVEYMIEEADSDNSRDSDMSRISLTSSVSDAGIDNGTTNEIVTFTLNVATGGLRPLLQAADISPYEAPQEYSNVKCKCKHIEVKDEFDAFGMDIAQQLRSMPTQTAIETQKLLMSVLRSKQSKILNDSFLKYIMF